MTAEKLEKVILTLEFRQHLINEERDFFGQQLGPIINGVQSLEQDAPNMGGRHLERAIATLVNQLRRVLKTQWSSRLRTPLLRVQRAAVALAKSGETGQPIPVMKAVVKELQDVAAELGVPLNRV